MLAGNAEQRIITAVGRAQVVEGDLRIVALDLHVEVVLKCFLNAVLQRHFARRDRIRVRLNGNFICDWRGGGRIGVCQRGDRVRVRLRHGRKSRENKNQKNAETFHGAAILRLSPKLIKLKTLWSDRR